VLPRRSAVEVGNVVTPVFAPTRRAAVDKGIDRIEISLTRTMACGMPCERTFSDMAVIGIRWAGTIAKVSSVVHVRAAAGGVCGRMSREDNDQRCKDQIVGEFAIVRAVVSVIRCWGVRMGKVQKHVLRAAGYMSTFGVRIQLCKIFTGNANLDGIARGGKGFIAYHEKVLATLSWCRTYGGGGLVNS
jgi:hypothetical protein